jgi:hypothetical protein
MKGRGPPGGRPSGRKQLRRLGYGSEVGRSASVVCPALRISNARARAKAGPAFRLSRQRLQGREVGARYGTGECRLLPRCPTHWTGWLLERAEAAGAGLVVEPGAGVRSGGPVAAVSAAPSMSNAGSAPGHGNIAGRRPPFRLFAHGRGSASGRPRRHAVEGRHAEGAGTLPHSPERWVLGTDLPGPGRR